MKFRITSKITISTVLTILFFGTLATGVVYYFVQKTVLDLEREGLQVLVSDSSMEIMRAINDSEDLTTTIAKQKEIVDFFNEPEEQDEEILKILSRYNIDDRYSSIYLMSKSGKTLVSTNLDFIGQDYSFRSYFQEANNGKTSIEFALGETSKEFGYYISAPIKNENNEIVGIAVTKMKPQNINQLVHQSGLTGLGHVMLVNEYGVIIYSDVPGRLYKSLSGLSKFSREEIEKSRKFEDIKISALEYGAVFDLIKENKKSGMIDVYDKLDKEQEVLTFSRVGNFPFFLVYEEQVKYFSSSALNVSIILSLFVLLAAIMATIVIIFLIRKFLSPLSEIINVLKEVSMGKMDKKIQVISNDEIGEVAKVFNEMTDRVRNVREEVEGKILDRTKELEKFNSLMVGREIRMIELKKEIDNLKKGIKKIKIKNWAERLKEAEDYEGKIAQELQAVSMYNVKISNLSKAKKDKIIKLLTRLAKDTERHSKVFEKLVQKYDRKHSK